MKCFKYLVSTQSAHGDILPRHMCSCHCHLVKLAASLWNVGLHPTPVGPSTLWRCVCSSGREGWPDCTRVEMRTWWKHWEKMRWCAVGTAMSSTVEKKSVAGWALHLSPDGRYSQGGPKKEMDGPDNIRHCCPWECPGPEYLESDVLKCRHSISPG